MGFISTEELKNHVGSLLLLLVIVVFILSGCGNGAASPRETPEKESADARDPEDMGVHEDGGIDGNMDIRDKKALIIGTWHDNSWIPPGYGWRYHFYEDGSYLLENAAGGVTRELSETGTWSISENTVVLSISSKTAVEGGEEIETLLSNGHIQRSLVNGMIKVFETAPPAKEEYLINNPFQATEENSEKRTMFANGKKFWKVHDNPNAYSNKGHFNDGDAYRLTTDERTKLIGTWHSWHMIPSQYDERYHFYDDGTYILEYSNYDSENRVLSESGEWNLDNGILSLIVHGKVIIEGGEKTAEPLLAGDLNEYAIVNGIIRVVELDAPETETYPVVPSPPKDDASGPAFEKDKEDEYSYGYWTMRLNGANYWRLTDDPDCYHDGFFEDGDVYSPWP